MTEPTAEAILAAILAAYRRFSEYQDDGVAYDGGIPVVAFQTRFRRDSLFEFAYSEIADDGTRIPHSRVLFSDGVISLDSVLDIPSTDSLSLAVAGLTGISRGTAHAAPSLLLEEVGGWLPTQLQAPERLADAMIGDRSCYQVRGGHPRIPSQWSILAEKDTWLMRRWISHDRGSAVTEYLTCRAV